MTIVDYLEFQNIENSIVLYPPITVTGKLAYNYKFGGKEYQEELGMESYDFGARNYDPALGRWMNIDPKAEASRRFSPYVYANNSPMFFTDPDGMLSRNHKTASGMPAMEFVVHEDGRDDWFKNMFTGEATYISGADANTKVSGYTYMCAECAKYDMPLGSQPTGGSSLFEGDAYYQKDGTKSVMNQGFTIGDADESGGHGNTGISMGFGVNGALGGGLGFEIGLVKDFATNNWGAYFSIKANAGLGGGIGVNGSVITPTGDNDFLINDFKGTGYEMSGSISTPIGGGGYSYGGSATESINGVPVKNPANPNTWGQGKRGYTTGGISPDMNMPTPGISGGALLTKSKTVLWDF